MNKYLLLVFLLIATLSRAASLDRSLVDANTSVYQKLLQSLNKDKKYAKEFVLEKSLLKNLIQNNKHHADLIQKKVSTPTNLNEYTQLFQNYLATLEKIAALKQQITQNESKIQTIEDEVGKLDTNSSELLAFELQDALHHQNLSLYNKQLNSSEQVLEKIKNNLLTSLDGIHIDKKKIAKELITKRRLLTSIQTQVNRYAIDLEQAKVTNNSKNISYFTNMIQKYNLEKQQAIKDIATLKFLSFSAALQAKDKKAFSVGKDILKTLSGIDIFLSDSSNDITLFINSLENRYFGKLETLTSAEKESLKTMLYQVWGFVNNPIFSINAVPVSIFKLFMTILIFISGFVLGALYKRKMKNMQLSKKSFTQSTRTLFANIGYYIIILIAFFIALNVLGVKLSSIAIVAGALSVGIGFGLQNIVSNFVSGLILMFERSVKIGDYIQLDDDLRGHVTDIRMRSTTINTNGNIDIIIPNQKLIENNVINWTMNDKLCRFEIDFDVAYGIDAKKVIGIIKEAVKESGFGDIYTSSSRYTRVLMTGLGDNGVNFQLLVWIQGSEVYYPKRTTSRFLMLIYETLNAHGIEIPFPQIDLHIRSIEDNLLGKQISID